MASLLDAVLGNRSSGVVEQIGRQFNLDPSTTSSALSALLPALAAGLKNEATDPQRAESLTNALGQGGHARYLDDLDTLGREETVKDGNGILGHIFGSKEVSREVASRAAAQTGVSADILKKLLPIGAAVLMGALAKRQFSGQSSMAGTAGGMGGLLGALGPLLGGGQRGLGGDDITGMIGKFMRQ